MSCFIHRPFHKPLQIRHFVLWHTGKTTSSFELFVAVALGFSTVLAQAFLQAMIKMLYFAPSRSRKRICTAPRQILPHMQRFIVIVDQQNGRFTVISKACSWCPYLPTQASQDYVLWRGSRNGQQSVSKLLCCSFCFGSICSAVICTSLPRVWFEDSACAMAILFLPTIFVHISYFHRFPIKAGARIHSEQIQSGSVQVELSKRCLFSPHLFLTWPRDLSQLSYLSIWLSWLHSKVWKKTNAWKYHQTKIPKSNHMAFGFSLPPVLSLHSLLALPLDPLGDGSGSVADPRDLPWDAVLALDLRLIAHTRSVANTATTREKILATWIAG